MASKWRQFDGHGHVYAAKRALTAYPCHVCSAECQQADNCIQCDSCEAWMHATCIRMSTEQLNVYSILSHAQFFCLQCTKDASRQMNFRACLSHIAYLFSLLQVCGHHLSSHANLWQLAQQLPVPSVPIAPPVNTRQPSKPKKARSESDPLIYI